MKYHYKKGVTKDYLDVTLEVVAILGFILLIISVLFTNQVFSKIIGG